MLFPFKCVWEETQAADLYMLRDTWLFFLKEAFQSRGRVVLHIGQVELTSCTRKLGGTMADKGMGSAMLSNRQLCFGTVLFFYIWGEGALTHPLRRKYCRSQLYLASVSPAAAQLQYLMCHISS